MKQLSQNLRDGKMDLQEVAIPSPGAGQVVVRTTYSLISAGTEGSKVQAARSNLIEKARQRPEQVKQVLDSVRTDGLATTYQKVMNKLDTPAPLGYSSAGVVISVGAGVRSIRAGDRVACGGVGAAHGEIAVVTENLCAPIPAGVDDAAASFATVGAIALQGVRQADLRLGENCVVIGLGLVGQLTMRLLRSAGIQALGVDVSDPAVEFTRAHGEQAVRRDDPGLAERVAALSDGFGTDAVIITAGTSSLDPVELAGQLCRQKGRVIVVGAVPTGFSRTNYYEKELDLRMSCSYGPGRYNTRYEDEGLDYPIGYVRWTENRNLRAFLGLAPQLSLDTLVTHTFPFEQAIRAFDLIAAKTEFYVGILLRYDTAKPLEIAPTAAAPATPPPAGTPSVGVIGVGSFAQKFILPAAAKSATLVGVADAQGVMAQHIAKKYGFQTASSSADGVLTDSRINTVFIATRHNSHAELVLAGLRAGKHVFVEKPLCLREEELEEITRVHQEAGRHLMLGFNRRFSPHIEWMQHQLSSTAPRAILYRINAGHIPKSSWIQDPAVGGGRILGEVCHFLDLAMHLAGAGPVSLAAQVIPDPEHHWDSVSVNLAFANGSIATVAYYANGASSVPKEYLEVACAGETVIIEDFRMTRKFGRRAGQYRGRGQDKGHAKEIECFLQAVKSGGPAPIPFDDIRTSMQMTFDTIRSLQERRMVVYGSAGSAPIA
ncbi:MAG: bi-domain-containing oxidoreductase [Kiritimatiellae bacterium]|nr:bi-domain-containing oxidoreductase [Kiritimatiellia bacterium]